MPLAEELFTGASVVIGQLPKSLDALREISQLAAAHSAPGVAMFLGGRVKHMSHAMNEVLGESFTDVRASLAHQKSRVLLAHGPRPAVETGWQPAAAYPLRQHHLDLDLWVCAHGAAFAGTKIDIGTRFLLEFLDRMLVGAGSAVDLGCGTGIIATALARARPRLSVLATDDSAAAASSAQATAAANGLAGRVQVLRDDAMSSLADASVDLIVCNPPFHQGTSVSSEVSLKLFRAAGRVLKPGGRLWTVFNSPLPYQGQLSRTVGPTRVIGRNPKFTVTMSTKPDQDRPRQSWSARR
jgi:16S rRNA (guanine1207-N2)-methyltransferase